MENIDERRGYRAGATIGEARRLIAGDSIPFGNEMCEFVLGANSEKVAKFVYNLLSMGVEPQTILLATRCIVCGDR